MEFRLAVLGFLVCVEGPVLFFLYLSIRSAGLSWGLVASFAPPILVPLGLLVIFWALRRMLAPRLDPVPYFGALVAVPTMVLSILWLWLTLASGNSN